MAMQSSRVGFYLGGRGQVYIHANGMKMIDQKLQSKHESSERVTRRCMLFLLDSKKFSIEGHFTVIKYGGKHVRELAYF